MDLEGGTETDGVLSTHKSSIGGHWREHEQAYFKRRPELASEVYRTADLSGIWTSFYYISLGGGDNDESDAFRHSYWMALLTKSQGETAAREVGERHEYGNDHTKQGIMDLHNNEWGIQFAKNNPNFHVSQFRKAFNNAVLKNELIILEE